VAGDRVRYEFEVPQGAEGELRLKRYTDITLDGKSADTVTALTPGKHIAEFSFAPLSGLNLKRNFVPVTVDAADETSITVSSQDVLQLRVPVGGHTVAEGSPLTLGVRPHGLAPATSGAILGRVALIERLGSETIVNVELPSGVSWLAVLTGDHSLNRGESLAFNTEGSKTVLFDSVGNALPRMAS
jgi:hypothetical protein